MPPAKKTGTKKKAPQKPKTPKSKGIKKNPLDEYQSYIKGDGVAEVLRMEDSDAWSHIRNYVSTQSLALDKAIGFDGLPCGRIIEIAGDNHTGKSTILDHVLAETQSRGGVAILADTEFGRDKKYASQIGVDPTKLLMGRVKDQTLEGVMDFVIKTINFWTRKEYLDSNPLVIGVDSIAGLPTRDDLNEKKDFGKSQPGQAAKTLRQACRILRGMVAQREVCLVFVNHLYTTIGVHSYKKSYGGDAIPFHSALRLKTFRIEDVTDSDGRVTGLVAGVKVLKSKINGSTGASARLAIMHGRGIDNVWTIFDSFLRAKYIASSGGWFTMQLEGDEAMKWQGKHMGLLDKCAQHPDLFAKLVAIYQAMP